MYAHLVVMGHKVNQVEIHSYAPTDTFASRQEEFDLEIQDKKGSKSSVVDHLSHLHISANEEIIE